MAAQIDFLTVGGALNDDVHQHAQLVLLLDGFMELDIGGKTTRLSSSRAAFIEPGVLHSQLAQDKSRTVRLNCDLCEINPQIAEQLASRVFMPVSPAARRLIEFAELAYRQQAPNSIFFSHWVPLLLSSLLGDSAPAPSRISFLLDLFEQSPASLPNVREMARRAGLSASRLHALFISELGQSPQKWLAERRIRKAQELLVRTELSVVELALRMGYADQSAFTKAMRRVTGQTPAAYRREQRNPCDFSRSVASD